MAEVEVTLKIQDNTRGLYQVLDPAATVDNVFIFLDQDGTKVKILDTKGPYIARLGGVLPGSDMTSKLNTIFSHSDVNEVVFDDGDVTISGTLNCQNKKVVFKGNGKLIGAGTFDNGIISAGERSVIFGSTINVTNSTVDGVRASVYWFGATGDGSTDDKPAIQKAMDTCIANIKFPRDLYFPKPLNYYRCTSELIAYKWDGASYIFFSLNLIGETSGHFTSADYSTRIVFTHDNTFGIGYQRARSSRIHGLSIEGSFARSFGSQKAFFEEPFATFISGGGSTCRDNRHSPYSGVVIDPFFNEEDAGGVVTGVVEADRYPGLLSWYRGTGTTGGTSAFSITQCRINKWTVGVMYTPNGRTLNAENCLVEECAVETCKVAFAFGQAQIKDNYLKNTIHWDTVHTVVDADSYGSTSGLRPTMAYIDGMNIAGGVARIFNVRSNFVASAKNIFAESLFMIGVLDGGAPITIEDSEFDFIDENIGVYPEYHVLGSNILFKSCQFKVYDDLFNKRMILKGIHQKYINCKFDLPPILPRKNNISVQATTFEFEGCYSGTGFYVGASGGRDINSYLYADFTQKQVVNLPLYSGELHKEYKTGWYPDLVVTPTGSYTSITVNTTTREATLALTVAAASYLKVGDYILESEINNIAYPDFPYYNDNSPILGKVKTIDYGTGEVVIHQIPRHITTGASYYISASVLRTNSPAVVGDVTNGNATITNVIVEDNIAPSSLVGQRVGQYRVVSADDGARTITLNAALSWTLAGYIFEPSYEVKRVIKNDVLTPLSTELAAYARPFIQGTVWEVRQQFFFYPDQKTKRYVCTKSGYLSASTLGLAAQYQSEWVLEGSVNPEAFTGTLLSTI
jgi:hypothetical protein